MRNINFKISHLRSLMDVGSLVLYLPWGVEAEKVKYEGCEGEWIIPRNASHDKVILYFHGGGYAVGSTQTHRALVGEIAKRAGFCALIPEYRLAPEHPFPAALEDAFTSYKWLLDTGHLAEDIIIAGDSAGGGLAIACLLEARKKGLPMPAAMTLISPWVDLTLSQSSVYTNIDNEPTIYLDEMRAWARNYCGDFPADHPQISPLYADFKDFPPMIIQVSDSEVLVDEGTLLAKKAAEEGVQVDFKIWKGLIHVWHIYWRYLSQAREAIDDLVEFILKESPHMHDDDRAFRATLDWSDAG